MSRERKAGRHLNLAVAAPMCAVLLWVRCRVPYRARSHDRREHLQHPAGLRGRRMNPTKIDSYVAMTFSAEGRPLVAKEFDYLRWLIDQDGDGLYESERILTQEVHSCQGLWFDGPALYATCMESESVAEGEAKFARIGAQLEEQNKTPIQGSTARLWRSAAKTHAGLWRIHTDPKGRRPGRARHPALGTVEEHGRTASARADGELWYAAGETTGRRSIATSTLSGRSCSTIRKPTAAPLRKLRPCQRDGCAARCIASTADRQATVDGRQPEHVRLCRHRDGRGLLVRQRPRAGARHTLVPPGADHPRRAGGNYGYRNGSGKYPVCTGLAAAVRDLNRGSPVAVETYLSYAFRPTSTTTCSRVTGRAGGCSIRRSPRTARPTRRATIRPSSCTGSSSTSPTSKWPGWQLYFSTGGRSSQGGFWRIRYTGPVPPQPDRTGILAVVRQPQPLSSWGWAAIERVKPPLGEAAFGAELEKIARSTTAAPRDRVRALYEMQRHGPKPSGALLRTLVAASRRTCARRRSTWAGQQRGPDRRRVGSRGLKDANALVRRRALEAV